MNLFQTKEYLNIFSRHFCRREDIVGGIWEKYQDKLILLGMKPVLGGEEVTDYAPTDIEQLPAGKVQLDYVREDSLTYQRFGPGEKQEVSPYLNLPGSWDEYLTSLPRRYRKELKRKFKRLNEVKYEYIATDNLDEFIRLHRLSDPSKKQFMTEPMAAFFKAVFQTRFPDWENRLEFLIINGQAVAGIISFVSQTEVWLYNSGFDPRFNYYSPGLLLKAKGIQRAIEQGKKKYDFLRGSERYKYELWAKDLNLYRIEITI